MKKFFERKLFSGVALTLISLSLVLAGCGGNNAPTPTNAPTQAPTQTADNSGGSAATAEPDKTVSGTVTVAGSTSVQPLADELGILFMESNKGARIEVAGGGSGAGVKAAQTSTADIGMASRALKAEETGIKEIVIAVDGIAVVVNKDNVDTADLTPEQIKGIFTGAIKNWSEVGGKDANIVVVNREEGSGTRDAFAEIVLGGDPYAADAIIQNSTGAVREAVSNDPNAIGYISLGGLNDSVHAVKVNGVEVSEATVKSGDYAVSRPFSFLVNESAAVSDVTQAFIDYVLGDEGQAVVVENGFVSVK